MSILIGPEYLIGTVLIKKLNENKNSVSLVELMQIGRKLQTTFNNLDIDAIVMDYGLVNAVYQFNEYFQIVELDNHMFIKCSPNVDKVSLEKRFIGHLPFNILQTMIETVNNFTNY